MGIDPASEHGRGLVECHRALVELRVGMAQTAQDVEDSGTPAAMPRTKGVLRTAGCFVADEEVLERGEVSGKRRRRLDGFEPACRLEQRTGGIPDRRAHVFSRRPGGHQPFKRRQFAKVTGVAQRPIEGRHLARG